MIPRAEIEKLIGQNVSVHYRWSKRSREQHGRLKSFNNAILYVQHGRTIFRIYYHDVLTIEEK